MILYEDLKKVNSQLIPTYLDVLSDKIQNGWYILGEEVSKFETSFADFNNSKFCIGVANGLDALILGLKVYDFPVNSEVLVPSNTYIATILSIIQCGLKPILVEPSIDDYLIDVSKLEDHISVNTVAIIPVHLYGKACSMDAILSFSNKYNLKVIEDCAQAHGAEFNGQKVGTFGDIGAFSFYPTKNLGALGDAGAILVKDEVIFSKLKALRNYGSEKKYYNKYLGMNSRLDEIQAVFLNIKLPILNAINLHKKKLANIYDNCLNNKLIIKPKIDSMENRDVFHIYPIRTEKRDELKEFLLNNHIGTEIHYPVAPHLQEGYKDLIVGEFPVSELLHSTLLSLPISYAHTVSDIEKVCEVINRFEV